MNFKKQAGQKTCLVRDFLSRRLSQNGDLAADYHTDNIDYPENCGSDEIHTIPIIIFSTLPLATPEQIR